MTARTPALLGLALPFSLAACGGGGASPAPIVTPPPAPPVVVVPPPPPPPVVTPPVNYDTAEYRRSNAAAAAGAITAYNAGATGRGVKLAVIDSGVNPNLAEVAGRIDPGSADLAGSRGVSDEDGHGTAVTVVAAGARNSDQVMGVAFDATILSFRADRPGTCAQVGPEEGCEFFDAEIVRGLDAARANGARVVNMSLGGEDAPGTALLAAIERATAAGIVVVISAGNEAAASPDRFSTGAAARGNGALILAGSIGAPVNGDPAQGTDLRQLSTFSNRAGASANQYLAALGYRVRTIDHTGDAFLYSGTSFSAPVISGAAALLAQAFPNLSGAQIVEILLTSADDLGDPGTDATFGRGALNISRAFAPRGATTLGGTGVAATGGGELGGAMGDAGARGTASVGAVLLDGYSRAYAVDLATGLTRAAEARPLASAVGAAGDVRSLSAGAAGLHLSLTTARAQAAPWVGFAQAGLTGDEAGRARALAGAALMRVGPDTAVAFGFRSSGRALARQLAAGGRATPFAVADEPGARAGFAALQGTAAAVRRRFGALGVTASTEGGEVLGLARRGEARYRSTGLSVDRASGPVRASVGLSRLQEEKTMLGGRLGPALGGGAGATSWFTDAAAAAELGAGWSLGASWRSGRTTPGASPLLGGGALRSTAFSFDLSRAGLFAAGDRLGLRVAQPLRVGGGGLNFRLPTSYDYATGGVGYGDRLLNLTPSGRELVGELGYSAQGVAGGWFDANLFARRQPGHVAAADADYGAAVRFTLGL